MPAMIGRYAIERVLGSGGMGEVYLAFSPAGDPVAIKLIRADQLDPTTRARFEKEAKIAATVVGTNRVARFLEAAPYADRPWLAMEYIPGRTLQAHVDAEGPLPTALTASLGALLGEGLQAVHAAKLLHRDLKPQNVIMGEHGPILIDFGLGAFIGKAKDSLSNSGMIIGTARCMSPEQASGNPHVSTAADVYGLGVLLLFASTGHFPYEGASWQAIVAQVSAPAFTPDLDGLPADLHPLVSSMLHHTPESRPTLDEVFDACKQLMLDASLTPAQVRHLLIDRTSPRHLGESLIAVPSESALKRIEEQARVEAAASGDDGPDSSAQDEDELSSQDEASSESPAPEPDATPSNGAAAPRRGRPAASQRIADDLRRRYAANPSL
ncbi:putative serine/threonine-protein kinase pkwA [Actinosynnema pretiosum subsp. pretiosum]|nr:putative serine/threonine-protein kinase pkwA [Actinosynnema pretiosum subsp. pretiosum]